MDRFRPRLTYANVVSTICLFLALGGAAWAATSLPKNSVGTPQLKNGAVTSAKVKNGSLTGSDINSSTLGKVPQAANAETATSASHAATADSANHADSASVAGHATSADRAAFATEAATLGGRPASSFYPAGGVARIDAEPAYQGATQTIYSGYALVLTAACFEGGEPAITGLGIDATSSAPGAEISSGYIQRFNATEKPVTGEHGLGSSPVEVWSSAASTGGSGGQSVGTLVFKDDERAIQFTLESRVTATRECQVSGTAVANG